MDQLPVTLHDLARAFGMATDDMQPPAIRIQLSRLLTQLAEDVSADQNIDDGHPRFFGHVTVCTLFGLRDEATQDRIDSLGFEQVAEANQIEREAIAWIRGRWLN